MAVTEEQLTRWARGPSDTEAERCETTIRRITEALRPHFGYRVTIFVQGSYRNNTNVRQDSDIDVAVQDDQSYFSDLSQMGQVALQRHNSSFTPSDHTFEEFKTQVHRLLAAKFGQRVERRNKCIFVPETATGVNGDVVPCFVHKRFDVNGIVVAEGIEFAADDGRRFNSFPQQHYDNGVAKNDATRRMYKRMVRILKNVRGELVSAGTLTEDAMASFFIESLTYNALPDNVFLANTYFAASKQVIAALWTVTEGDAANRLLEVNRLKWLFSGDRTVAQARAFLQAAYTYIGH